MKGKWIAILMGVSLVAMLSGCQGSTSTTEQTTGDAEEQQAETSISTEQGAVDGFENMLLGQVKAIDGNTITIALAEMGRGNAEPPDRNADGEVPQGQDTETSSSDSTNTTPMNQAGASTGDASSGAPSGGAIAGQLPPGAGMGGGPGGMDRSLNLPGEEQTFEVSDSTVITINNQGKEMEGSLSDLTVDSVLQVVLSGNTATKICVTMTETE